MLIALIGPDGCGKTSVANAIADKCADLGFRDAKIYECNFRILPTFSELRAKFSRKGAAPTDGHASTEPDQADDYLSGMKIAPSPLPKALLIFAWYTLDYILGYRDVARARRNRQLLVFGRYYHDFFFQRAHRKLPRPLVSLFSRVIPEPDWIFFLKRDPNAIFEAKPELTPEEIDLQGKCIEQVLSGKPNFRVIDADAGLDETVQAIVSLIGDETQP